MSADSTALRVALWRALHVKSDPPPHVFEDVLGLQLAAAESGWEKRPDMHPQHTSRARASIVARARFVEDTLAELTDRGVRQYVILGAGLDTFVQRRPALAARLAVFEIDQPTTQAWKRQRLSELGYGMPEWLRLVPVDFEAGESWLEMLASAGFDRGRAAFVASTGVAMYLTRAAVAGMLREVAALAPGSTLALSFLLPSEHLEAEELPARQATERGARAAGTPILSTFTPAEMLALARDAGFREVQHVSAAALEARYFAARSDGLRPSSGEALIVATL